MSLADGSVVASVVPLADGSVVASVVSRVDGLVDASLAVVSSTGSVAPFVGSLVGSPVEVGGLEVGLLEALSVALPVAPSPVVAALVVGTGAPPVVCAPVASPVVPPVAGGVSSPQAAASMAVSTQVFAVLPNIVTRRIAAACRTRARGCTRRAERDLAGRGAPRGRGAAGGDAPGGLATRGVVDARGTDKAAIARAWIDEVVHACGDEFVTAPEPAFGLDGSPAFTPVIVREDKIGGVVVEGWERVPPGTVDESRFVLKAHRFAPGGALESETRHDFAVEGGRLREPRAP